MKIKVVVTVTKEMEINREDYPDGHTNEQILSDEIAFSLNLFDEWADTVNEWESKGEIIDAD